MGQAPMSQARPCDTYHLWPSNLAARTPRSVERTLSKFWRYPCPAKRGLVAAVKCCVRKAHVFMCRQRVEMTQYYRRPYTAKLPFSDLRPQANYEIGKQETKQDFAFVVLKPTQGFGFSCSVPKPARAVKKTCFSHTALDRRHESSPLRAQIMTKLGGVCFTECRVLAAKFEAVGGLSRGLASDVVAWHYFCIKFLRNRSHFRSENS